MTALTGVRDELLFPAELDRGDEVWTFADGHGSWARVHAVASGDGELLVWCTGCPGPLHLPASRRVLAHHLEVPADDDADHVEHMAAVDHRMPSWYAGDIAAAVAAAEQRRGTVHPTGTRTTVEVDEHLHGWYAGDLGYVVACR